MGNELKTASLASPDRGDDSIHRSTSVKVSGMDANEILPGAHRVVSLVKRWLLGTRQGSFIADNMPAYPDEFSFRFNRRGSRARGNALLPAP